MRFLGVIDARPPNYEAIVAVFPGAAQPGVIFAYGDRIYAPGGRRPSPALQAHEQVHCERQGARPEHWWGLYLTDPCFRLEEELLAHRAEYRAYCERHGNRAKQEMALEHIAGKLAAPLYGHLISVDDARRAIAGV